MIWLAWRQFRTSAYVALGLLLVIGLALLITGPSLVHTYDTVVKPCVSANGCASVIGNFSSRYHWLQNLRILIILVPAVLGLFWGAPLVAREMENNTFRLAWTQSVTRRRWFLTRFALVALAAVVTAGLYSLMVTWWMSPFNALRGDAFGEFDHGGITPVGYALFAVALGVLAGAVLRRTLPAIGVTLFGFLGARLAVISWVRPHLAPTRTTTMAFALPTPTRGGSLGLFANQSGNWVLSDTVENARGQVLGYGGGIGPNGGINFTRLTDGRTEFVGVGVCPNQIPSPPGGIVTGGHVTTISAPSAQVQDAVAKCVAHFHLRELVTYQPASHYWPIQFAELGVFVALALALGGAAYWWVCRRLA